MTLDEQHIVQNHQNGVAISLKTSTPLQEKDTNLQHFSISPDKSPALYELDKRFMQLKLNHTETSIESLVSDYQFNTSYSKLRTTTRQNSDSSSSFIKWPYHDPHNYRIVKNNSSIDDLSKLFKLGMDVSSVKTKYSYMSEYFQTNKKIEQKHNRRIRF